MGSVPETPIATAMPDKTRPSHFHGIKVDRFRVGAGVEAADTVWQVDDCVFLPGESQRWC